MTVPAETLSYVETVLQRYAENPPSESDYKHDGNHEDNGNPHWDMMRELKDDSFMASLPSSVAIPILESVRDLRSLGYETTEEAEEDLAPLWDKVKLGLREGPLEAAVRLADSEPLSFKTTHYGKKYQRFLNIAYRIQGMRGDDYICLPVERLGEILSVSPKRITDFRVFAMAEGFLREVGKAHHFSKMATKFRFTGVVKVQRC